jgi:uncharacterized protein (DUF2141 family)
MRFLGNSVALRARAAVVALLAMSGLTATAPSSAPALDPTGPDAAACVPGAAGVSVVLRVSNFKSVKGSMRVQVYNDPKTFLERGAFLRRFDVPVKGPLTDICVSLPAAGRYGIMVRHDADGDTTNGWRDGFGFTNRVKRELSKPKWGEAAVDIPNGRTILPIRLFYI